MPHRWPGPSRTGSPPLLARGNPSVLVKAGSAQDRLGLLSLGSLVRALHCAPTPPTLCGRSLARGSPWRSVRPGWPRSQPSAYPAAPPPSWAPSAARAPRPCNPHRLRSPPASPCSLRVIPPAPSLSASSGSTQTLSYSLHKTPTLKAQLGVWILRRRPRKNEIAKPVGGPSAKRRLPFVFISAQALKSST